MLPSKPMIDQASAHAKTEQWIRGLKILALMIVGVAIFWAVYALWASNQESKALKAFSALAQADTIEMHAVRDAKVLSDDPMEVLREATEDKRKSYVEALENVRRNHGGTVAAHIAALRLGRWALLQNDNAQAEKLYRSLLDEAKGRESQIYATMASEALGVVLENQGRWDEALQVYEGALVDKNSPLRPLLMMSKARVLAKQDKRSEAKATYDDVVQNFPNSPYSAAARALAVKVSL